MSWHARVEGAPARLAADLMGVPVIGWIHAAGGWSIEPLAVVLARPTGTEVLAIGDLAAYPEPDEGPGADLGEAERDRLVAAAFLPLPGMNGWQLQRASGSGTVPDGLTARVELGLIELGPAGPQFTPPQAP